MEFPVRLFCRFGPNPNKQRTNNQPEVMSVKKSKKGDIAKVILDFGEIDIGENSKAEKAKNPVVPKPPVPPRSALEYTEEQLQCSICTEILIKTVTLNCSHSFCRFCIDQWKRKKLVCPICRVEIMYELPTIVVDNFIDKVLESASSEFMCHRQELVQEREQLQAMECSDEWSDLSLSGSDSFLPSEEDDDSDFLNYSLYSLQQSSTDSIPMFNLGRLNELEQLENIIPAPLLYTGEGLETQEEQIDEAAGTSNEATVSVPSKNPRAHYGGYGNCFNCGQKGHWRNGCPNRRKPFYGGYGVCHYCKCRGHWANGCPYK